MITDQIHATALPRNKSEDDSDFALVLPSRQHDYIPGQIHAADLHITKQRKLTRIILLTASETGRAEA